METNKNMETINKAINSLFAIQKQLKKSQLLDQSQHNSLEEISINIEKIQHHINEKANDEDETRVKTNVKDANFQTLDDEQRLISSSLKYTVQKR